MPVQTTAYPTGTIGFLAFPDQFHFLKTELINRFNFSEKKILNAERYNDLIIFLPEQLPEKIRQDNFIHIIPYWARAVLTELFTAKFESISEAASLLKQIRRNWTPYTTTLFRRTALIQEKLPYINFSPRRFPTPIPKDTTGIYSLLDNTHLIAAPETTAVFPSGILEFQEDHENPPSRAYLKLQEALTYTRMFFNRMPEPGNRCFDAGACPGGWTWVLSRLGCSVFAVDRAELSPELMTHPSVTFTKHNAFTLSPEELGAFDWIFSDVICYPERLLDWIKRWNKSGLCKNIVCTIKMQGNINWNLIEQFATIPYSKVLHLNYNKHELTWLHCEPE